MTEPPPPRWPARYQPRFYDRQGQPMSPEEFGAKHEIDAYRRIGQDVLIVDGEPCNVSTVWLGIDHSFGVSSIPIIFETMVFGGPYDMACMRYATELAAQEGHFRTVANLAAGQQPWFDRDEEGAENGTAQQD